MKHFKIIKYIVVVFVLSVLGSNVHAIAFDELFYSNNDILFYDPRAQECTTSESSSTITISGGDNIEKAFNFFVTKGYSPQQAAGVVGNMVAESGVLPMRQQGNPATKQVSSSEAINNGLGWGLVQWTPPSKMIRPSLESGVTNKTIDTLEYQLQFLWEQLEGSGIGKKITEKAAGDDLKSQSTIDGAAKSFMTKYERPRDQGPAAQKHRSQLANDVFGKFGASSGSSSVTGTDSAAGLCGSGTISQGDIVSIAKAELAKNIVEKPIGCDANNPSRKGDCGAEVNKYTDSTLEFWCADFVSWVYKQAGKPFTGGQSGGWRIASVSSVRAWFEENGIYTKNGSGVTPKAGDVYMTAGESHIGIVERVEGNIVYTISGNTSTENYSNGVGVGAGQYKIGSGDISGYGSLK